MRAQPPPEGLPAAGWVLLASGVTAVLAALWPLATYGLSLALFGLAHVLTELRYLDGRFGPRLGQRLRCSLGGLLLGVALLRLGRIAGWVGAWGTPVELGLVVLLLLCAAPALAQASLGRQLVGVGATLGIAIGLQVDPFACILLLAILHNWTPVGFAAEATTGAARRRALALSAVVFGLVPLGLALGLGPAMEALGWRHADAAPLLRLGPLEGHLGAFLPEFWRQERWAEAVFGAVAYAQCMHYAAVLHVLPRLQDGGEGWLARLPAGGFRWGVAALSALFFAGFWWDFTEFRPVYGVFAAVHAWVEWPLLLMALAGRRAGAA